MRLLLLLLREVAIAGELFTFNFERISSYVYDGGDGI